MSPLMRTVASMTSLLLVTGCSAMPADVDGTFDRASGGTLVVGVSVHHPYTEVDDSGTVTGSDADLITGFAEAIDADIDWHDGPESTLAEAMRAGEVDVVIGGLDSSSPWVSHMALTRPYGPDQRVMGVRLGENELLITLERHLAREFGEIS